MTPEETYRLRHEDINATPTRVPQSRQWMRAFVAECELAGLPPPNDILTDVYSRNDPPGGLAAEWLSYRPDGYTFLSVIPFARPDGSIAYHCRTAPWSVEREMDMEAAIEWVRGRL